MILVLRLKGIGSLIERVTVEMPHARQCNRLERAQLQVAFLCEHQLVADGDDVVKLVVANALPRSARRALRRQTRPRSNVSRPAVGRRAGRAPRAHKALPPAA